MSKLGWANCTLHVRPCSYDNYFLVYILQFICAKKLCRVYFYRPGVFLIIFRRSIFTLIDVRNVGRLIAHTNCSSQWTVTDDRKYGRDTMTPVVFGWLCAKSKVCALIFAIIAIVTVFSAATAFWVDHAVFCVFLVFNCFSRSLLLFSEA